LFKAKAVDEVTKMSQVNTSFAVAVVDVLEERQ
jgi:hypothetical protein